MISFKKKPNTVKQVKRILNPNVENWFFSRFKEFSLPQLYGVMEVHSRNNVLISAPTGSTKTLTAFLSILNELHDAEEKGILKDKIYAVYVSPLRALNNDILKNLIQPMEEIQKFTDKKSKIRIGVRTGDTTAAEKSKMLKNAPHILITTPESLAISLSSKKFKEHFTNVDWFIADELHALADNKRGVHLSLSMERLQRMSPGMCRVGLSATIAPLEDIAGFLVGNKRPCKIVDVQFIKDMKLDVMTPVKDLINTDFMKINTELYKLLDSEIKNHKTTLIFTNTRSGTERIVHHLKEKFPKNYYEIDEGPPQEVASLIGAHHGSLAREHRFRIENALKEGKLRAIVSSTSLELGIDIGYIDLVLCLGSPKSVARFLQRVGRSGHQLHSTVKGNLVVSDRDDLVECSVLLKHALEKKIDKIQVLNNCLDVLAQHVFGMALEQVWDVKELFNVIKKSYCYKDLSWGDFEEILSYLAGEFGQLEERHVYGKIWYDRDEGKIGKRGRLARVIYMTNIGTIPDQTGVIVKIGNQKVGTIDENFCEKLKPGDRFVLGGNVYSFKYSRGMVAQVNSASGQKPTIPSWFSESLPLSFDLANGIQKFRALMKDKFDHQIKKKEIIQFIQDYLYVRKNTAEALYNYMNDQHEYVGIPNENEMYIEHYSEDEKRYVIFHTLYGRRVNDALSRCLAYAIARQQHKDVEIGINDNGFYLSFGKKGIDIMKAFKLLKSKELRKVAELAIDKSEVLKKRFRHCAGRSLMILRNYKGRKMRVGRQQVSSMILMSAARRISDNFVILKEAKREVLEDLMDINNTINVLKKIENNDIEIKEINTNIPSPFSFNIVMQGYSDILKMEDKSEFLKRMHTMVLAKIALKKGKKS